MRVKAQYVYPASHGRATKQPRKAVESCLLAQLSKLETIVKRMEGQSPSVTPSSSVEATTDTSNPTVDQQFGRLVIDDMQSCYVSSTPWMSLGDKIKELRDLLHTTTSEEEEGFSVMDGLGKNAAIMGFRALAHLLKVYHPPMSQAMALFEIFKTNVSTMYMREIQRTSNSTQSMRKDSWRVDAGATTPAMEGEAATPIAPAGGTSTSQDPDWERVNLSTNGEGAMGYARFGDILGDTGDIFNLTTLDIFGLLSESAITFQGTGNQLEDS
ncbi:hypothetical protein BJX64DRAFT_290893 [Aspergillus heterothallicus]